MGVQGKTRVGEGGSRRGLQGKIRVGDGGTGKD